MTNPFHGVSSSGMYAIDIVEINAMGNRAVNVFPTKLPQYHIFRNVVNSPCKGWVLAVVSSLPDNKPAFIGRERSAGNHIVIGCNSTRVRLAHLKKDSLKVGLGDDVLEG